MDPWIKCHTFAKDRNKRTLDYYILNIYLWFQGGRTRQQPVLARSRTIFDNFDPFLAIFTLRGPCLDPEGTFFAQKFSMLDCSDNVRIIYKRPHIKSFYRSRYKSLHVLRRRPPPPPPPRTDRQTDSYDDNTPPDHPVRGVKTDFYSEF